MILLDTNVISELMRTDPAPAVLDWIDRQDNEALWTSSITIGEIRYGLALLPHGQRRSRLEAAFEQFVRRGFKHRIVDFDQVAAERYGEIMASRRNLGRPMAQLDGQIGAIGAVGGFAIATRNTLDFRDCGLDLIDPFIAPN